jgi:hypothetical protein
MPLERLTPGGTIVRFLTALLLVYASFNPEGISFFHWTVVPLLQGGGIGSVGPLKLAAGILLLIAWLVFLRATSRTPVLFGAVLLLAGAAAIVWLLIDWHLVSPGSARAVTHLTLVIVSFALAIAPSWSSVTRRGPGQPDITRIG